MTFWIAKGGAPVTDLRPYLDAPLHVAVVKDDLSKFLHEHGTVAEEARQAAHGAAIHAEAGHIEGSHDGSGHGAGSHSHGDSSRHGLALFGPELRATIVFPEPGRYYLFGQAAHGEKLLISRFPVEVD